MGAVTFRPLGKVEMERIQKTARSGKAPAAEIEGSLLIANCVLEPRFDSAEQFMAALDGHDHVLADVVGAIRAASWPNRAAV